MDAETRQRLDDLKDRTRKRLRRAREGEYVRALIPLLRASAIRGRRIGPAQVAASLVAVSAMPGRDERVDWSRVPGARCSAWTDRADRDAGFRDALAAVAPPAGRVIVVWYPEAAGLALRAADAARLAGPLLDLAPTVWVVPDGGGHWLVESAHFDHEVCFGPTVAAGDS